MENKFKKFFKNIKKNIGSLFTVFVVVMPHSDVHHRTQKAQLPEGNSVFKQIVQKKNTLKQTLAALQGSFNKNKVMTEIDMDHSHNQFEHFMNEVDPEPINTDQKEVQNPQTTEDQSKSLTNDNQTEARKETEAIKVSYTQPPPEPAQPYMPLSTDNEMQNKDLTSEEVMHEAMLTMSSADTNLAQARKSDEYKKAYEENLLVLRNKLTRKIYTVDKRNADEIAKYKMQLLSGSVEIIPKKQEKAEQNSDASLLAKVKKTSTDSRQ